MINAIIIIITCHGCGREFRLSVSQQGLDRWQSGELIQNALSDLTDDERELLISQTCGVCWDEMFGPDVDMEEFEW